MSTMTTSGLGDVVSKAWHHRSELNAASFFVRNATKPWLLPFSVDTINHANDATREEYTKLGLDDGSDAFRHAYTAAQFVQRLSTERELPRDVAVDVTRQAGRAHEDDTEGEWLPARREMDLFNNEQGMALAPVAAETRAAADALLRARVLEALEQGSLKVFDEHYQLRSSDGRDMPGAPAIERTERTTQAAPAAGVRPAPATA